MSKPGEQEPQPQPIAVDQGDLGQLQAQIGLVPNGSITPHGLMTFFASLPQDKLPPLAGKVRLSDTDSGTILVTRHPATHMVLVADTISSRSGYDAKKRKFLASPLVKAIVDFKTKEAAATKRPLPPRARPAIIIPNAQKRRAAREAIDSLHRDSA